MREETYNLLTITVNDFGPIKEGKVTLRPLTIFFGKNNTGKTYMGYLIWGIIKNDVLIGRKVQSYDNLVKLIRDYISSYKHHTPTQKFPFGTYEYVRDVEILPTILFTKENIQPLFNFPIQFKQAKATTLTPIKLRVKIELKEKIPIDKELNFSNSLKPLFGFGKGHGGKNDIEIEEYEFKVMILRDINTNKYHVLITALPGTLENEAGHIVTNIINNIINFELRRIVKNPIFIPASKSGFVLLSKLLVKNLLEEKFSRQYKLIKYTSEEEGQDLEVSLPDPIVDFIKRDPTFSQSYSESSKAEFKDIVEFLENNLLKGKLEYNKNLNLIKYLPSLSESLSLPLQYSSSLVVESIPLLLYLKHTDFIRERTLVIIEEPEAHLHPDAQRILARALVKLVNRGIYVLLITHSPYILQQINNNIKLYYLKKAGKEKELKEFLEKHDWGEDEILNPSKVAPYLFDDSEGYTKIRELEIFEDEGISSEAFYHTIRELFNETYELVDLLESANKEKAD